MDADHTGNRQGGLCADHGSGQRGRGPGRTQAGGQAPSRAQACR